MVLQVRILCPPHYRMGIHPVTSLRCNLYIHLQLIGRALLLHRKRSWFDSNLVYKSKDLRTYNIVAVCLIVYQKVRVRFPLCPPWVVSASGNILGLQSRVSSSILLQSTMGIQLIRQSTRFLPELWLVRVQLFPHCNAEPTCTLNNEGYTVMKITSCGIGLSG